MSRDTTLPRTRPVAPGSGDTEATAHISEDGAADVANTSPCLVGTCTEDRHPDLQGRVRVRWTGLGETEREAWLPVLQSLSIRQGDRVLVQHPQNWPEPVVTGVVDGFATRPEVAPRQIGHLGLKPDEAIEIRGPNGAALLEIRPGPSGPVLRILGDDLDVDVPGRLQLRAGVLRFVARRGSVRIEASDDVVVEGEMIKLN